MDTREAKALEIAATLPVKRKGDVWTVPSQAGHGSYRVSEPTNLRYVPGARSGLACTCPDFDERQGPCKHVLAVEFTMQREATPDADVVKLRRPTYPQNWPAYNAAQCQEKEQLLPMLADLCGTLSRPYGGRGRPPLPVSDMAFACVSRVYSGLSARRFDSDVREAAEKGLTEQDPHFNSVLRYLRSPSMTAALRGLVELSALPLKAVETDFAVDSTGFTTSRFERWYDHKWGKEKTRRQWVKLHAMTGVRTNVVTAVELSGGHSGDSLYFKSLLATTAQNFDMRDVSADKAYSSKAILQAVADEGATPYIPFRGGIPAIQGYMPTMTENTSAFYRMQYMFAYQRDTFLAHYHQRSNVETTFSMIKRKFGDSLRSKSETGQMNEILCKVVAHNLCCIISALHELGIEAPQFQGALRV